MKKIITEIMERIMLIRSYQESYMTCKQALSRKHRDYDAGDCKIWNDLVAWELAEWHNLMMWGIAGNQDEIGRIKVAAYERFLTEKYSVAEWLNDGILPDRWLKADEDEFREMAKQLFQPTP